MLMMMIISIRSDPAIGTTWEYDGFDYEWTANGCQLKGKCMIGDIVIPDKTFYDGVEYRAQVITGFSNCRELGKIAFKESHIIDKMMEKAFYCSSISETLTLPIIYELGNQEFSGCTKLIKLDFFPTNSPMMTI